MNNPPTAVENLRAAELRAHRARGQLQLTLSQVQGRLDPRPRAEKAVREARVVGETAVAIAKSKPAATGGVAASTVFVIGAFLLRHRIVRLFAGERSPPATAGLNPVTHLPDARTNP